MTLVPYLAVQCDLCGSHLTAQMLGGADPEAVRMIAASPYLALFANIIDAEDAATVAGWDVDHASGHVQPDGIQCRTCINRQRTMHAWIKQNRMHDEQV